MAAEKGTGARVVKKKKPTSSRGFYILLALVIIVGGVWIGTMANKPKAPNVRDVDVTAAQAEGYAIGNPKAPVQVLEFADFECPACGQFSTVTEPDVRTRLAATGKIGYRFYDFPLPMHKNTITASLAAACANEQGKFWEMHDALFFNQPEWSTQATDNPTKFFAQYAGQMGLDMPKWKECMAAQRHLTTIIANRKEGERRGVGQTPTFIIGRKVVAGSIGYDEFKARVDSAAVAAPPAPAAAPVAPAPKKKP